MAHVIPFDIVRQIPSHPCAKVSVSHARVERNRLPTGLAGLSNSFGRAALPDSADRNTICVGLRGSSKFDCIRVSCHSS